MGPLETIGAGGVSFKAKYIKRTGTRGNYKYWYRNPKTGKLQAGKQPAKRDRAYGVEGFKRLNDKEAAKYEATKKVSLEEGKRMFGNIKPGDKLIDSKRNVYVIGAAKKPSGSKVNKLEKRENEIDNKLLKVMTEEADAVRATEDKQREFEYKKFNEKINEIRAEKQRKVDAIHAHYRNKSVEINKIVTSGKKTFRNTGEIGVAMEQLEKVDKVLDAHIALRD